MRPVTSQIFLILSISIIGFSCSPISKSSSYPIAFYRIEAKGEPSQMKVRMVSNYTSVAPNQQFKIGFFFKIKEGWYTYSSQLGGDNLPTEIVLKLPAGFEILREEWPEPTIVTGKTNNQDESVYNHDFVVIYTLKAPVGMKPVETINAMAFWQVCRSELCTIGGAQMITEINTGKKKRSKLYSLLK